MNLKEELIDLTQMMHDLILEQNGVKELETEDFGWENYRYESPMFRLAHVERYFKDGLIVAHVTCIPHANNPSPIFGFDVVGSEKTGKISGAFVDHSPTLYDKRWHYTRWSSSRILPEWATVFSDDFLAIRPNENEYEQLFDFAYGAFTHYFNILNESSPATDDKVAALIREKQENYCKMQASNPRTYAALKHQLGPERAQHFMENILFPQP